MSQINAWKGAVEFEMLSFVKCHLKTSSLIGYHRKNPISKITNFDFFEFPTPTYYRNFLRSKNNLSGP
jgi:hypothetical protein